MNSPRRTSAEKPMSIAEITKRAEEFEYNLFVPLRYWLRTADTLVKEARIYELEGNFQQAYLLYFRHAKLVLEHLQRHPDVRLLENRFALDATEKAIPRVLERLEILKPRIARRYDRYKRLLEEQEAQVRALPLQRGYDHVRGEWSTPGRSKSRTTTSDPALAGLALPLAAGDNQDLAVRLAHHEIRRRQTARKATFQAGTSSVEEQARRTGGVWSSEEHPLPRAPDDNTSKDSGEEDGLQPRLQRIRHFIDRQSGLRGLEDDGSGQRNLDARPFTDRIPPRDSSDLQYPHVPRPEAKRYEDWVPTPIPPSSSRAMPSKGILKPPRPPEVPPKIDIFSNGISPEISPVAYEPGLPAYREGLLPPALPIKESLASVSSPPAPQADPQPSDFTFKPSAYLENGTPLRTVFLPPTLRSTFLEIASPNTRRNLETCGILCGTLISNALFVSRLVVPEQVSTTDTCETVNEEEIFDYCDAEDLIVLGWIHTHPSQTCFMSSRDLHTHSGYQVMLPESIAIVCAPSKSPSWGIFRLTDPPGLKSILSCREQGLFHPHAETHIYTDALRPGHVFEAKGLQFEVADLRPGR